MIDRITDYLVKSQTIREEDKDIYSYGLKQGVTMLLQTVSVLLIGVVMGMWWQSVLFIFSYTPLRLSSGGIHAGKPWLCYIFTAAHAALVLLVIGNIMLSNLLLAIAIAVSTLVVWAIAPVEDKNKPFDEAERKTYKKRTIIVLVVELVAVLALMALGLSEAAKCVCVTHVSFSVMVAAGAVSNKLRHKVKTASGEVK